MEGVTFNARATFDLLVQWRHSRSTSLLRELAYRGDPRLEAWWESDEPCDEEARLIARRERRDVFSYAFTGSDEEARRLVVGSFRGAGWSGRRVFEWDHRGNAAWAIYVVLEDHRLILAPWSSEHVLAASEGTREVRRVLAAGEVACDHALEEVSVLSNHSGGYWPAASSVRLAREVLGQAGARFARDLEIIEWPRGGFTDEDFLAGTGFMP